MYLKILIISQMVCMSVFSGLIDISSCPAGPLWKYRAAVVCRVPEQYHCLYDSFNSDGGNAIYVERCFPPKRYKGKRYVVSGYLDAEDCQKENYSPYPITSNVNTGAKCPLKKSLCNEEGQVTVSDGSSSEDRVCRCNFEEGYRYINEPPNPCRCHPFLEDCSCYRDKCSLVTGNVCKQPTYFRVVCDRPLNTDINEADTSESLNYLQDNQESVHQTDKKTFKIVALILILAAICIGASSLIVAGLLEDKLGDTDKDKTQETTNDTGRLDNNSDDILKTLETKPSQASCQAARETNMISTDKEFYGEGMFVVEYYVPTVELKQIKEALLGEDRKHLVILEGMHGCGKKQTAYKFCNDNRHTYSFVCKLEFYPWLSFVDIVEKIPKKLQFKISQEQKVESKTIIDQIQQYLKKRGTDRFLFFLDKVDVENNHHYGDIRKLLALTKELSNLDIIVATTDASFKKELKDKISLVKFNGMVEKEYFEFFKNSNYNVQDIKTLVETIGSLPLVLYSAFHYLKMTNLPIPEYIKILESHRCNFTELKMYDRAVYTENAISSQKTSLKYIEGELTKECHLVWEILKYLKYLCYRSISVTVLDALYYHKDKECLWEKKKGGIHQAIIPLKEVCLCEVQENRLEFHDVTIWALKDITGEKDKTSDLQFLLKAFCYEIDIDARTGLAVARNLLFIKHAEKICSEIEQDDTLANDSQVQFCQSYLHCAIGSTLLFQRTQIHHAHKHLMKARRMGLLLVKDESEFDKNVCTYQRKEPKETKEPDCSNIRKVASNLHEESSKLLTDDFVREFIIEKRRSQNDVAIIKATLPSHLKLDLFDMHYLSKENLEKLVECKLALNVNHVSILTIFLAEFILRILHNNALALYELTYIASTEDKERYKLLQKACYAESENSRILCEEICSLMKSNGNEICKMFVCLEIERSSVMLKSWYRMELERDGKDIRQKLEVDINKYKKMIEHFEGETQKSDCRYYDFGVVKISNNKYNWHTAICRQILIRYLMKLYDEEKMTEEIEAAENTIPKKKRLKKKRQKKKRIEKRKKIYDECVQITAILEKQVEEIESDVSQNCWLSLPLLFIQCGKCLHMTERPECALKCFEKAIKFEIDRGALFTRVAIKAYEWKIKCLLKLKRIDEAIYVTDHVIETNKGKNRDNIVDKFQKLMEDIKSKNAFECIH